MLDYILKSHNKSHDHKFCDNNYTIAFFFGISSDKQAIVKKKAICNKLKNLLTLWESKKKRVLLLI